MYRLFTTLFISLLVLGFSATAYAYSDIDSAHQNIDAIEFATDEGIVQGYGDDTFRPDNNINRVEFLKILIEGIGVTPDLNQYNNCFPDVTDDWYASYVCYAKEQGWVQGYPDETFKPTNNVNKVEAIKMLLETQEFSVPSSVSVAPYADVSTNDWFAPYVEISKSKGLIDVSGDFFKPANLMTRASVVEITYRGIMINRNNLGSFNEYVKPPAFDPYSIEALSSPSNTGSSSVILLVDETVSDDRILGSLSTFVNDLENESYNVTVKVSDYTTPEEIRDYLKQKYTNMVPQLEGAILFGEIPYAYRVIDDVDYPIGMVREAISYEFYQDLDGTYSKDNSSFPNAYSVHEGNTDSEIWVTILPWQQNRSTTIQKIDFYLDKNHIFRTQPTTADGFAEVSHHFNADTIEDYDSLIDGKINGQYSWLPSNQTFSIINIFIENSVGKPDINAAYGNLTIANRYVIAAINSHGSSQAVGNLNSYWLINNSLRPYFLFLGGCNSGNLDIADPTILVETVYNENSDVVFAQGTSTFSGGLGTTVDGFYGSNILREFINGNNIGQSMLYHANSPLIYPWDRNEDTHHGITVLVGDGTLKMKY